MKEPTISVAELEMLARTTFGESFLRLEVRQRVKRSEKITIYIREPDVELDKGKDWTHSLTYAHDRPRGDPDAVRKHVRTNLQGVLDKRAAQ